MKNLIFTGRVRKKTIYRGNCLKKWGWTVCRFKRGNVALLQYKMIVNKRYKLVAMHKCKCICKMKAKTSKILNYIKTLLTVKTYTTFRCK